MYFREYRETLGKHAYFHLLQLTCNPKIIKEENDGVQCKINSIKSETKSWLYW